MNVENLSQVLAELKTYLVSFLVDQEIIASESLSKHVHFVCPNPEHEDTNPSCNIMRDGLHGLCHGCGARFDLIQINSWLNNAPMSGPGFITNNLLPLCEKYGVEVFFGDLSEDDRFRLDSYRVCQFIMDYISVQDWNDKIISYIESRGFTVEDAKELGIGIVPSYNDFYRSLRKNWSSGFLKEVGIEKRGMFSLSSIIFPITDPYGTVVGFVSRDVDYEEKLKAYNDKGRVGAPPRKYDSSPERNRIYYKRNILFGLDKVKGYSSLYVFEGQFDWAIAKANGLDNCIALGGVNLTSSHLKTLIKSGVFEITLVFDSDSGGEDGLRSLILGDNNSNGLLIDSPLIVKVVELPQGEDPGSYISKCGISKFLDLDSVSSFAWALSRQDFNLDPVVVCERMLPLIIAESNRIQREVMIHDLAEVCGLSVKSILDEVERRDDLERMQVDKLKEDVISDAFRELRYARVSDKTNIMRSALERVEEIDKTSDIDLLSTNEVINAIREQNEEEMSIDGAIGLRFGELQNLEEALNGSVDGMVLAIGGCPNTGKCQRFDTPVLLSDGTYRTIEELYYNRNASVITMNNEYRLRKEVVSDYIDSGVIPTLDIKLDCGIEHHPSLNHPYYTPDGWKKVSDLKIGDYVAVVSNYSCFDDLVSPLSHDELIVLACLLAEGGLVGGSVRFISTDEELRSLFMDSCLNLWPGITFRFEGKGDIAVCVTDPMVPKGNRAIEFCKKYGLWGSSAIEKIIPDDVFRCSKKDVSLFLSVFFACDGWVSAFEASIEVVVSLANQEMIQQLRHLLLRFGLFTRIGYSTSLCSGFDKRFTRWSIGFYDINSVVSFAYQIGFVSKSKQYRLSAYVLKEFAYCLEDDELINLVDEDIVFDKIVSISDGGMQQCYDLTVSNTHNFVASDVVVHNTALMSQLGHELVMNNDDTVVVLHTIDDTRKQFNRRLVMHWAYTRAKELGLPLAESLALNKIASPKYWIERNPEEHRYLEEIRAYGYDCLKKAVFDGRLIIKDTTHGRTVNFLERLCKKVINDHPGARVVAVLDNFHRARDFDHLDDTTAVKRRSKYLKQNVAQGLGITVFSTFEYTKIPTGQRPTNNNLRDAADLEYDINYLEHLFSPLKAAQDTNKEETCFLWHGHPYNKLPIVEGDIGKNKVTEVKAKHYYKFFPAQSRYEILTCDEALTFEERNRSRLAIERGHQGIWIEGKYYKVNKTDIKELDELKPNVSLFE